MRSRDKRWSLSSRALPLLDDAVRAQANLQTGYDDNVRFTSSDAEGAAYVNLDAGLRAIRSSDVSNIRFAFGLAGNWYSGVSDLDNTSGFAGLDLDYRLERHLAAPRTRSRLTVDPDQRSGNHGVRFQFNRQQNTLTVSPGWTYLLSERATLDLSASYQEVAYEDVQNLPLFNYRLGVVDFSGSYLYTERLALIGRISYGRYETQGPTNNYDNVDLMGGAEYQLSETASLSALFGLRRTEQMVENLDKSTITLGTAPAQPTH